LPSKSAATVFFSAGESFGECAATTLASAIATEPVAEPAKVAGVAASHTEIASDTSFAGFIMVLQPVRCGQFARTL
jgi:hypothetical protein